MKKIMVSIGHSKVSGGASNSRVLHEGVPVTEYAIAKPIAQQVTSFLSSKLGPSVQVGLIDAGTMHKYMKYKMTMIDSTMPEIALEIHLNSYDTRTEKGEGKGTKTHPLVVHWGMNERTKLYADKIIKSLDEVFETAGWKKGKVIPIPETEGYDLERYALIHQTAAPTIIVEVGFINHDAQAEWLLKAENQQACAKAIATGVMNAFLGL